jgi:Rrf2 family protein
MSTSSRFAVAVHVLALLAMDGEQLITSEYIAGSVNTNPVVIRRILGRLREAGLVIAQSGVGGGASLVRRPERITLLDVYQAVEAGDVFSFHPRSPNPHCVCGRHIQAVLGKVFSKAEAAMEKVLAEVTVAQIMQEIEARASCTLES